MTAQKDKLAIRPISKDFGTGRVMMTMLMLVMTLMMIMVLNLMIFTMVKGRVLFFLFALMIWVQQFGCYNKFPTAWLLHYIFDHFPNNMVAFAWLL